MGYTSARARSYIQMIQTVSISECRIPNCLACFNAQYCTRCATPYIAYRGQCIERCPNGLHYANFTMDCRSSGKISCNDFTTLTSPWTVEAAVRYPVKCDFIYSLAGYNSLFEHLQWYQITLLIFLIPDNHYQKVVRQLDKSHAQ